MKLSFLGAAPRSAPARCFLVEAANARLLVECGMVQGGREAPTRNRKPFEFDPASVANRGGRARRRWNCLRRSMCNTGLAPCPRNSPVASSNGSPSHADWSIARR